MAWTDRFVSPTGAGAHNGTTAGDAWTLAEAITGGNAGHEINVIAGTYPNTTATSTFGVGAGAATTTAPKRWRGYKTTIGDLDTNPTVTRVEGTDIPLFTWTTGSAGISGVHQQFENIHFRTTGASGTRVVGVTGSKCKFVRCRFEHQQANAAAYACRASVDGLYFTDCWFSATSTASHVAVAEERMTFSGCTFRGAGNGVFADGSASQIHFLDCIFDDNGDDGIEFTGNASHAHIVDGCTFYSPGGHGINITTAAPLGLLVRNCLFHTVTVASKYAVNMPAGTNVVHICGCAYYNVTTRNNNVTEALEYFPITESSDPCVNAAGHDFTLVSGASGKGAALAGLFENESYKSYRDAGALQRQESGGATTIQQSSYLSQNIGTY